jgi:hypothetical protein
MGETPDARPGWSCSGHDTDPQTERAALDYYLKPAYRHAGSHALVHAPHDACRLGNLDAACGAVRTRLR